MSWILKFFKYSFLLSTAFVFLYFSLNPDDLDKYFPSQNYQNRVVEVIQNFEEFLGLGLSKQELDKINNTQIFVNYPQKSQSFVLSSIGVTYDKNRKMIVDESKFNQFKEQIEEELSYLTAAPIIDLERNEFYSLGKGARISLNKDKILDQLSLNKILIPGQVRLVPHFDEEVNKEENIKSNQELISKISNNGLLLKAGRREFNLDSKTINSFFQKRLENEKEIIAFDLNRIEIFLKESNEKFKFPTEINYKLASVKLATHLSFRITEDRPSRTFILPIDGSFSLSPEKHKKFVEVNKSQQRAYLFENGKLVRTLIISTGVTWETPSGEFKVLNKVPMTISYTNNWYMPWYLPIGTINGPYYFGFHEVPYHMDHKGLIYSRDPETIGSPATGGCIQVLKGQAKEIFDWAEVGMPVYITE